MKVYARKEKTTDDYIAKYAPSAKKFDVQVYRDKECKTPFGRFMWYQSKPRSNTKFVTLNCYRWELVWKKEN